MHTIVLNKPQGTLRLIRNDNDIKLTKKNNTIKFHTSGRRGLPGEGDKNFVKNFTNLAEVTVVHGLNKRPAMSIEDSAGDEVEGEVEYVDLNTMIVRFSASFTGRIICN